MTTLTPIVHELLDHPMISHGFFTRNGGVSAAPYNSLNTGLGSRDDPAHVHENRRRIAAFFGQTPDRLLSLYQIHSAKAEIVDGPWPEEGTRPEADGLVTTKDNLVLSALSADCATLLWADTKNGVIGACHAGWKGALYGMIESELEALLSQGAAIDHLTCVIGPCIGQISYEVGVEFETEFLDTDSQAQAYFIKGQSEDKRQFDLAGYCLMRLRSAGLTRIGATGHDTCAQASLFFSNRRAYLNNEGDYGRLMAAIMLRP